MPTYKGKWHGEPFRDFKTKKYYITIELERAPKIYDETKEKEIAVSIESWSEKRSGTANRYYYEIVGKIAAKLYCSKTEVHNMMLAEYGQPDTEADDIMLDTKIDWRKIDILHLIPRRGETIEADGRVFQVYGIIRGSHTYNTKEMAQLIDGTVEAAKELGIETIPPEELERLKKEWEKK